MKKNIILNKTFNFSVRIINLYKHLIAQHKMYDLGSQILRSGTSIGANAEEAVAGISKKDFRAKFSISLKEARETHYWLRLLNKTNYLEDTIFISLLKDNEEIIKILTSIVKNSKED